MSDSRSLARLPVYDVTNGRVVGRVHRLIVDPDARKVAGLLLSTRLGREARCLPFRSVHAIGEDAVTVRGTDAVVRLAELPDMEEFFRTKRRLYDSPVLTEDGTFVGEVDEFIVNTATGRIETLLVSGGLARDLFRGQIALPAHLVLTIGEDATIVRDQAVALLKQRRKEALDRTETAPPATDEETASGRRPSARGTRAKEGAGSRLLRLFRRPRPAVHLDEGDPVAEGAGPEDPSTVPADFVHEARLQQHRPQNGDDVVPTVAGDGGEGGDGKL